MKKMVDFEMLLKLMTETPNRDLAEILCFLAMNEVPMSEAVEDLGRVVGVFHE